MIDRTDLRIIEELQKDGRASYSDMAENLDIATSTVTARIQKLEQKGILMGFRPVIDYEELGFNLTVMINLKAEADKVVETSKKLKNHEKVISFFEVTGKTDMIIISRFIDRKDMNSFIKNLQQTDGISSTETNVILTTPKLDDNMDLEKVMRE